MYGNPFAQSAVSPAGTPQFQFPLSSQGMFGAAPGPNGSLIGGGFGGSFGIPTPERQPGQGYGSPAFLDPLAAVYAQQAQLAQLAAQGFFGQPPQGSFGGPGQLGGQFGHTFNPGAHAWGNQQAGGGFAGPFGRLASLAGDPLAAAYAQHAQLAQLALQAQLQQSQLTQLQQAQWAQLQQLQLAQQLAQQQAPFAQQGPFGRFAPFQGMSGQGPVQTALH